MKYYGARSWTSIDLQEIWKFRDLIWSFAMRDLKVRYRQTMIGIAWAVLQPMVTVLVFAGLMRVVDAKTDESGPPYIVMTLCALLPWQLFANTLTQGTVSIVSNQQLVTKVYFPRMILPIATLIPAFVDFLIAFALLICVMIYYGIYPGIEFLLLPIMTFIALWTSLSFTLWLSSLNAIYRDVQYAVPFLVQTGLFISPVAYDASMVLNQLPDAIEWLYWLNPMVGVIESFRWAVLGTDFPPIGYIMISIIMILLIFVSGVFYFRRMERFFADRI